MTQVGIRWAGEIDLATLDGARALLERALDDSAATGVVVDLSAVTFLDSSALHLLLTAKNRADRNGVRLVVVNVTDRVRKLFEVTDTLSLLGIAGPDHPCVPDEEQR